jgi:hypothetical protein
MPSLGTKHFTKHHEVMKAIGNSASALLNSSSILTQERLYKASKPNNIVVQNLYKDNVF